METLRRAEPAKRDLPRLHAAETPSAVPPYAAASEASRRRRLPPPILPRKRGRGVRAVRESPQKLLPRSVATLLLFRVIIRARPAGEIGRASCRERVCQYV